MKLVMVSACLLGLPTRYDGKSKPCKDAFEYIKKNGMVVVPFCPEQLGGLPTPRPPAEIQDGQGWTGNERILNKYGEDVTEKFIKGAEVSLMIAEIVKPALVILKDKSPSCGLRKVYDGSFENKLVDGMGITAFRLKKLGYKLLAF